MYKSLSEILRADPEQQTKRRFRNGDKLQVLSHREWIGKFLPTGPEGFVAEDLDLVIRIFGERYNEDGSGSFKLCEIKTAKASPNRLDKAQLMTFGLIDKLLREADPGLRRYKGFYLIYTLNPNWEKSEEFFVNGNPLNAEEFREWLECRFCIQPMKF